MAARPNALTTTSYAEWVRRSIIRNSGARNLLVSLFESSIPEPVDLVREVVMEGFGEKVTSRYASTFVRGNPFLIAALARDYGVDENQVLTTTGATGALSLVYRALVAPGERILIENPGFDLFANLAHANGNPVDHFMRRGAGFGIDPQELDAAIGPDTRLVVLSNLHNPSGMALDDATMRALGDIADRRGIHFVFDEVYGGYAGDEARPAVSRGISPHFISVSSVTKIYGLSTLRCGWMVADENIVRIVRDLANEVEFAISNLAHGVAAMVVENPARFTQHTFSVLARARPIIESYHEHWLAAGLVDGALPRHGCIAFPRLVGISDTLRFSGWLSDRCGVLVAPGDYFGAPGHIRLGFGMEPSRLDYGLQALTDSLVTYRENNRTADG